jgi:hypothetical protein
VGGGTKKEERNMCEFVSFIEYKDDVWFLTNDCLRTKEGKALRKYLGDQFTNDIRGHGAIRRYYGIPKDKGVNEEITRFDTPNTFPPKIVEAIKDGAFSMISPLPMGILRQPLYADYYAKRQLLDADRYAKRQLLDADYYAKLKPLDVATWKLIADRENRIEVWQ